MLQTLILTGLIVVSINGGVRAGELDLANDPLAAQCLNLGDAEWAKFEKAQGLIELRAVSLPRGDRLFRNSRGEPLDHLGWPVGAMIDGTIYVFHLRVPGHADKYGTDFVKAAVVRSTDQGETFHPLPGLEDSALDGLDPENRKYSPWNVRTHFGSWGNAAAVVDGKIIVTNLRGVYRSEDKGVTWKFLREAGLPAQIPTAARWGQCPRLLVHPDKGIVSIGATTDETLVFRSSRDFGETWVEEVFHTGEPLQEPAGTVFDGKLVLMPRHNRERWRQYWSEGDWLPLKSARNNITPGERDTTDIAYNPVSGRIEAVVTNRIGGGPGHEDDNCMTINLWSVKPQELMAGKGEWRFDGTLLRSEGREHDQSNPLGLDRDGMHPGGTIVDVKSGFQYIYVYLGFFPGPCGVFQVKRTLDTDSLREFLLRE